MVKHLPAMRETWVQSLGWKDPLEKEMETHSSTLSWKIPWMEEPGRLQSMCPHNWATLLLLFHVTKQASQVALVVKNPTTNPGDAKEADLIPGWGRFPGKRHGNPLPYSRLENLMNRGVWVGAGGWAIIHRVTESRTWLSMLSIMFLKFFHVVACISTSFLFMSG